MDSISPSSRHCRRCQQVKPSTDFYPYDRYLCKSCLCTISRERAQRTKAKNQANTQPILMDVEQTMRCRACQEVKTLKFFRKDIMATSGHQTICKKCHALSQLERNRSIHPEIKRNHREKRYSSGQQYTLPPGWYEKTLAEQNGICAACGRIEESRRLAIDHDHETGELRGLLCGPCNLALGFLYDNPNYALGLYNYIRKYKPLE